jgi:hypothetical protein
MVTAAHFAVDQAGVDLKMVHGSITSGKREDQSFAASGD